MESNTKKYGVFISYSHEDSRFVAPIVALVSAMRKDLVFQDSKELTPAKKWEPQLWKALEEAEVIIVFWCKHSAKSEFVRKEYQKAIGENKDVLPVLPPWNVIIQVPVWLVYSNTKHKNTSIFRSFNPQIDRDNIFNSNYRSMEL